MSEKGLGDLIEAYVVLPLLNCLVFDPDNKYVITAVPSTTGTNKLAHLFGKRLARGIGNVFAPELYWESHVPTAKGTNVEALERKAEAVIRRMKRSHSPDLRQRLSIDLTMLEAEITEARIPPEERENQYYKALNVKDSSQFIDRRVILVDDTVGTGVTLSSVAKWITDNLHVKHVIAVTMAVNKNATILDA